MKEANVGSEAAKRAVETIKGLSQYLSTQILLARDDVFMAMIAAMNAAPPEASAALSIYCGLSEMETGPALPYLGLIARRSCRKPRNYRNHGLNHEWRGSDCLVGLDG